MLTGAKPRTQIQLKKDLISALANQQTTLALDAIKELKDVNFSFNYGKGTSYYPLHLASYFAMDDVVKALIEKGALTAQKTKGDNQYTALHLAFLAEKLNEKVIEMLVTTDPKLRVEGDHFGSTPLHYAAKDEKYLAVLRWMLRPFIDNKYWVCKVDVEDHQKNTPLHIAALNSQIGACKLLLEHGANARLQNRLQEKPADVAQAFHPNLAVFIRKHELTLKDLCVRAIAQHAQLQQLAADPSVLPESIAQTTQSMLTGFKWETQRQDTIAEEFESVIEKALSSAQTAFKKLCLQ